MNDLLPENDFSDTLKHKLERFKNLTGFDYDTKSTHINLQTVENFIKFVHSEICTKFKYEFTLSSFWNEYSILYISAKDLIIIAAIAEKHGFKMLYSIEGEWIDFTFTGQERYAPSKIKFYSEKYKKILSGEK